MSIGFMVDDSKALIWRGPMVQSAIYQMLRDVNWAGKNADGSDAPLDILVVDMPPGTGDAQLTMAQKVPLAGAVIVSTPQDIALLDARRGVQMFEAVHVPILGVIENMSTHVCSNCGHEEHIFGHGGARAEADKMGVPFLGEIPLHIDIRTQGDAGAPIVAAAPDSAQAKAFDAIAQQVIARLKDIPPAV
jgi:ATP-binding protein involved in chromosome partitioning